MTVLTNLAVDKDIDKINIKIKIKKQKGIFADDQFHKMLRAFKVLPNFPITTSETIRGYCL